jgi:hypothetical protein
MRHCIMYGTELRRFFFASSVSRLFAAKAVLCTLCVFAGTYFLFPAKTQSSQRKRRPAGRYRTSTGAGQRRDSRRGRPRSTPSAAPIPPTTPNAPLSRGFLRPNRRLRLLSRYPTCHTLFHPSSSQKLAPTSHFLSLSRQEFNPFPNGPRQRTLTHPSKTKRPRFTEAFSLTANRLLLTAHRSAHTSDPSHRCIRHAVG